MPWQSGLQQLDQAEPTAPSATSSPDNLHWMFGPDAFAPINPVAAAAHPGVEVTLAGAPQSVLAAAAAASAAALAPAFMPLRTVTSDCGGWIKRRMPPAPPLVECPALELSTGSDSTTSSPVRELGLGHLAGSRSVTMRQSTHQRAIH